MKGVVCLICTPQVVKPTYPVKTMQELVPMAIS